MTSTEVEEMRLVISSSRPLLLVITRMIEGLEPIARQAVKDDTVLPLDPPHILGANGSSRKTLSLGLLG